MRSERSRSSRTSTKPANSMLQQGCCPWRGLPFDGEIDDGPAAECDREPRHQPARSDLGRRPFAHALCRATREIREALRPRECGRTRRISNGAGLHLVGGSWRRDCVAAAFHIWSLARCLVVILIAPRSRAAVT